ncbi:MAG: aminodeoxychorismate/anthranilate synthase component II [Gemmatimonadaceae bacterium]|jgi:anthranilate synthase/aminodeoxychorismate synthase-like glutamine amidotransferase|nr:aminodeoxychorismate/anthranilate synthase component II [Gemmatimonadaceae bacterium]
MTSEAIPLILVIDNYDSFTYNLVQYLGELGATLEVHRNDALTLEDVATMSPEAIIISPGPCTPTEAGISVPLIRRFGAQIPTLGVCLGHQAIGEAYGGRVVRAQRVMHGKTSPVVHTGASVFATLPSPLTVMRYHSLVVERATLPEALVVTAWTEGDPSEIQGLRHAEHPVHGVQFHPESILTEAGRTMLANFLALAAAHPRPTAGAPTA